MVGSLRPLLLRALLLRLGSFVTSIDARIDRQLKDALVSFVESLGGGDRSEARTTASGSAATLDVLARSLADTQMSDEARAEEGASPDVAVVSTAGEGLLGASCFAPREVKIEGARSPTLQYVQSARKGRCDQLTRLLRTLRSCVNPHASPSHHPTRWMHPFSHSATSGRRPQGYLHARLSRSKRSSQSQSQCSSRRRLTSARSTETSCCSRSTAGARQGSMWRARS